MGEEKESEEELKSFEEAGRITEGAFKYAKTLVKEGASKLEIAKKVEKYVEENKAKPSFPLNINIDYIAAHSTPEFGEEAQLTKSIVNIDFGASVNNCPVDASFNIDLTNENSKLVEATEMALQNAISKIKAGVKIKEVSAEIEKTIKSYGFQPIRNLSGHGLMKGIIHAPPDIPNVAEIAGDEVLNENQIIAIEPYATYGKGIVKESSKVEIFSYYFDSQTRYIDSKKVLEFIKSSYGTLPFAERWLSESLNQMSRFRVLASLVDLVRYGSLIDYPELEEVSGAKVAHSETTVIVEKDSAKVLVNL